MLHDASCVLHVLIHFSRSLEPVNFGCSETSLIGFVLLCEGNYSDSLASVSLLWMEFHVLCGDNAGALTIESVLFRAVIVLRGTLSLGSTYVHDVIAQ